MTAKSRGEDLFYFLTAEHPTGYAPSHFREDDLARCRELTRALLAERFAQGHESGQEGLRQAETALARRPAPSVRTMVVEGARTLFLNIPSILLVGLLFQLFQPLLNRWVTAFAVLEVARGPLKVGGDYVFNLALSGVRLNWRNQATLTGSYALVLGVVAGSSVVLTQVGSELVTQLVSGQSISVTVDWFDVRAGALLAFVAGLVAVYTQGFVLVTWVKDNIAAAKQARWLTLTRSYNRMGVNYAFLFMLAEILIRIR